MQSNANIPFSFPPGTDVATQNALMQTLTLASQNLGQNSMGGLMPNNQMMGNYGMMDQNSQNPQSNQLQGLNMANQMNYQMQQQMMAVDDPSQQQQMNYGGINPQALLAQFQNPQFQNGAITDAMTMALQGIINAQRNQVGTSGRENANSNNTVVLYGNQKIQSNQNNEDSLRLNTVYVGNLPQNVDHEMLKREFSKVGSIKLNSKSGMPMIWIFKDRGVPRGDALVTYDNNADAANAVAHFKEHDFEGCVVEVRIATNAERPIIAPPNSQGNVNMNNTNNYKNQNNTNPGRNFNNFNQNRNTNQYKIESISKQNDFNSNYNWQNKQGGGMQGGMQNKQNDKNKGPDWKCVKCTNNNFAWRDTCNRCQEPKPVEAGDNQKQQVRNTNNFNNPMNRQNKMGNRPNVKSQDGGPMRGPKFSNPRPNPY